MGTYLGLNPVGGASTADLAAVMSLPVNKNNWLKLYEPFINWKTIIIIVDQILFSSEEENLLKTNFNLKTKQKQHIYPNLQN